MKERPSLIGLDHRAETASLDIENLSRHYGTVRAVDGVSLHVRPGEFLTLLGPSGSGKTTTLRLVAGFTRPTAGTIRIAGQDVTDTPPHRRDIGMVFQHYALFPHMNAADNIAFPLKMRGIARAERKRLVDESLHLVRLDGLGSRQIRQLSGGQQQRVAFARATVFRPRLLLMDEPLGALDKKLREALQLEIKRLHTDLGITVLHVTHDQEEALVLSDRIALFNQGRIEQLGTAADLYERPSSVFVADFIGDSNIFRGRLGRTGGDYFVETEAGQLRCVEPTNPGVEADAPAAVIVRPEKMELQDPAEPTDGSRVRLPGRIRLVIYLGSAVKYEVETASRTVVVRHEVQTSRQVRAAGEEVVVEWRISDGIVVPDAPGPGVPTGAGSPPEVADS